MVFYNDDMKIRTNRLTIRSMLLTDNISMHNILLDFEASPAHKYDYPRPVEQDKINLLIRYWVRSNKYFMLDITATGETIGFVCYEDDEIGFSIITKYHMQGYGYEALTAFIEYMTEHKGKKIFTAQAALDNTASVKLLEKAGFIRESEEYIAFRKDSSGKGIPCICGNYRLEK